MIKPLISKSEIKKMEKKSSIPPVEYELIMQKDLSESRLQQVCRNVFEAWLIENKINGLFVQIDNGGIGLSDIQKMKKKREGTRAGFPDVMLITQERILFIEFKRIGGQIAQQQLKAQEELLSMGYLSFIINNTVFFKKLLADLAREFKI